MSRRREITGVQKVAAFLLSLDREVSARIMRALDPKVVSDVAEAMTALDAELCTPDAVDQLYADLARTVYQRTGVRPQDDFEMLSILENSFGSAEAERVIGEIHDRRRQEQPFGFLEAIPPEIAVRVLVEESAMVIALVLSHVSPKLSAEVLGAMQPEQALEIVRRMTSIIPPTTEMMLLIADDLSSRLESYSSGPPPRDPSHSLRTVAELLNFSPTDTEKAVLDGLFEEDEEVAQEIREFMFRWENLADLDKRAMQKVLASVDTRTLAMALKACTQAVEENIMNNLSSRVQEMVLDERDIAGAVPMSEVHAARSELMKAVRALIETGELSPTRAGEELVT
jgi:flagellar motor switch protein FliG